MSRRGGVAPESRATRGKATPNEGADGLEDDELAQGGDDGAAWKQEVEAITNGTHPELAKELKVYEQAMAKEIAQAQRIFQLQKSNIESLYDCEKKQADDEQVAQLEFYRSRLIDNIEENENEEMMDLLIMGIFKQMTEDGGIQEGMIGSVWPEEKYGEFTDEFFDDLSGERLDREGVKRAREEDIR